MKRQAGAFLQVPLVCLGDILWCLSNYSQPHFQSRCFSVTCLGFLQDERQKTVVTTFEAFCAKLWPSFAEVPRFAGTLKPCQDRVEMYWKQAGLPLSRFISSGNRLAPTHSTWAPATPAARPWASLSFLSVASWDCSLCTLPSSSPEFLPCQKRSPSVSL